MKNKSRKGNCQFFKYLPVHVIFPLLWIFPLFVNAQPGETGRLKKLLSTETDQVKRVEILLELSEAEFSSQKAIEHAELAINLADSLHLQKHEAHALHKSGLAWKKHGDNIKSAERLIDAADMFRSLGMKRYEQIARRDLGETYRSAQGFDAAMASFEKAVTFFKLIDDSVELAYTWNRMAATTFEMFYNEKDYISLDENYQDSTTPFTTILSGYPELMKIYNNVNSYLDSSESVAQKLKLTDIIISNEIIKGSLYNSIHETGKSISQYDKTMAYIKQTGHTRELPLVMINKARILGAYRMNMPHQAIDLAKEALKIAVDNAIGVYIFMAGSVLHDNYLALGDYRKAYEYLTSIQDLTKQFKYDNMKLLLMAQEYDYKIKKRELELKSKKFQIRVMIIATIFIVIVFSIFQIILIKKNKKLKHLLNELNNRNNIISEQNDKLAIINSEKDKLISVVAHDLRNQFNSIRGFSTIIHDDAHKTDVKEIKRYAGIIFTSATQTLQLLKNLLEWANFKQGIMGFKPKTHNLQILVKEAENMILPRAQGKGVEIINDIQENTMIHADHNMILTILRNLLDNAVKFSSKDDSVTISAVYGPGDIKISVKDTGVGIDENDIEKLFRIDSGFTTPGTGNENGSGFGLVLCKEFISKHNGTIEVESKKGEGSVFSFTIPSNSTQIHHQNI